MKDTHLENFIKENFRPLKTKENAALLIGRATYEWVLKAEKTKKLSHLTLAAVEDLIVKHDLKKVDFEDGVTYIVHPQADRSIMVSYYSEEAEAENPMVRTLLKPRLNLKKKAEDKAGAMQEGEKYLVSELALALMIRDFRPDETAAARAASELTPEVIIEALGGSAVRYHYEDGEVQILAKDEEAGDSPVYPAVFPVALPGTEVSMQQLDASQRTVLDGAYRDTAQESSHSVEHKITRAE